jgi:hypothetical protein
VKQGCCLSPTLFSVFANDLVKEINDLDLGITMGEAKVSILMYADDIFLIADSAEKLQSMLNTLHSWCKRWRVLINTSKSKCIHFRKGRTQRTDFNFKIGDNVLELVSTYKYLGVFFHEKNDFSTNCEALSKAAGRALGSIIFKMQRLKEFGFKTFEKLYRSCVIPILDYCASVWGYKHFQSSENIQNRAMRYFLGVHRFAPTLSLIGDTGWLPCIYRRWGSMLRLWNRLVNMEPNRLCRKVFTYDYTVCTNNWCSELKVVMSNLGFNANFNNRTAVSLTLLQDTIKTWYNNIWSRDIQNVPKLRTYRLFKNNCECEDYVTLNLKRNERAILSQFRCGILPLRIETGRFNGEAPDERLCRFCTMGAVEDENHFLISCECYSNIRLDVFGDILNSDRFRSVSANEKMISLLTLYPRKVAKYLVKAYYKRKSVIYLNQ